MGTDLNSWEDCITLSPVIIPISPANLLRQRGTADVIILMTSDVGNPPRDGPSLVLESGRHGDASSITCHHLGVYNAVVLLLGCGAFLCWYIPEIYGHIGVVGESRNSRSLWSRIG